MSEKHTLIRELVETIGECKKIDQKPGYETFCFRPHGKKKGIRYFKDKATYLKWSADQEK